MFHINIAYFAKQKWRKLSRNFTFKFKYKSLIQQQYKQKQQNLTVHFLSLA